MNFYARLNMSKSNEFPSSIKHSIKYPYILYMQSTDLSNTKKRENYFNLTKCDKIDIIIHTVYVL